MSENIYAEPGITKKAQCDQDNMERIVDIYVSAESLRVYENPWVEGTSSNTPGPAAPHHPVSVVSENSGRRNCSRTDLWFQRVVYLLFLAGIVTLICLWVQMKELQADNTTLREELKANNTELSGRIYYLWNMLCEKKPRICNNLDRPKHPW